MIFVKHRQNKIEDIDVLEDYFGIEVDLHSYGKNLVLHHDPFIKGPLFEELLKNYCHRFLIINIKEEGIENKVIKLLRKYKVKNYFLLDVTIPIIVKLNKINFYKLSLRVSKYENFLNILNFSKKNRWIWIDTFENKMPINISQLKILKKNKYNLCFVSPELVSGNKADIDIFYKNNSLLIKKMDMVCTKFPDFWKSLTT